MGETIYTNKRNETRGRIDSVYIEQLRANVGTNLTVKAICERAGINRSTFYSYYNDTVDMRKQIEDRLVSQFKERMAPVAAQHLDDPDRILFEIMEYNRENGFLPLLLIAAGSSDFVYRISEAATTMLADAHTLTDDDREKITMLFTYHFAGISMVMRQMKEASLPSDEAYENMVMKLANLLLPVARGGLLPAIKSYIKS